MRTPTPDSMLSDHNIYALNRYWPAGKRTRPIFGRYILDLPANTILRILDSNDQPIPYIKVSIYQTIAGNDNYPYDQEFDNIADIVGFTDSQGQFSLGSTPFPGDILNDEGKGEIKLGIVLVKLERPTTGEVGYAWVEITDLNVAYWTGQTGNYVHSIYFPVGERQIRLSKNHVAFHDKPGGANPKPKSIRVHMLGAPVRYWQVSDPTVSWLRTIPGPNYATGNASFPAGPLTLIVDTEGLEPGRYSTQLTVSAADDATIAPKILIVNLRVQP
jgi:hypothetical protein